MSTICTVGHSNRDLEQFIELLEEFQLGLIVDIRRFPSSRKFPHFNSGNLQKSLLERGIDYYWAEDLGGRRQKKSIKGQEGLSSLIFQSYAEHMNSAKFREAAVRILEASNEKRLALMCAEKLFWKCHRLLVSDYFVVKGAKVIHILDSGRAQEHKISPQVQVLFNGYIQYTPAK